MFFEKSDNEKPFSLTFLDGYVLVILAAGVMFVGLYWDPIYRWVKVSADFILG